MYIDHTAAELFFFFEGTFVLIAISNGLQWDCSVAPPIPAYKMVEIKVEILKC